MKTFGELEVGDIIFRYNKGGNRIEASRILKIKEHKVTVSLEYVYNLLGSRNSVNFLKEESTYDTDFVVFFSCKNAVEEFLLQLERAERERHWNAEKKIQKLKEQYEKIYYEND